MEIKEETKSDDLVKGRHGREQRRKKKYGREELQKLQNWYATGAQISFISKREKTTSAIRPKHSSLLPVNSCRPVLAVRSPVPWYETNINPSSRT